MFLTYNNHDQYICIRYNIGQLQMAFCGLTYHGHVSLGFLHHKNAFPSRLGLKSCMTIGRCWFAVLEGRSGQIDSLIQNDIISAKYMGFML